MKRIVTVHPTIRLKPREGRRVRSGAPWVFSNEVAMDAAAKALPPGAIVNIAGDDGRAFGTFYFNSKSLIAARQLDHAASAMIDADFLAGRLARALAIREQIYERPFYRLVHAEGDFLPGLAIDRFGDALVVQIATAGMEALTEPLLEAIDRVLAPVSVILRNDVPARTLEGLEGHTRVAKGEAGRVAVEENGLRYFAELASGQKTGWYYDQRDNRAFAASFAKGETVLDAYCYTGGFALAASRAGATECIGLDSSQPALSLAEESAAANRLSAKFIKADVFEELERLAGANEKFDVVVADPPPFVRSRKDLEPGAKAYRKLARLAANLVAPNGSLMLSSCSHNIALDRFALECALGIGRADRNARLIHQSGAGPDHPIHPMLPESAYLKFLAYALD
jgi:23S rRNA (cytosine1962-C5)-methyltransferase